MAQFASPPTLTNYYDLLRPSVLSAGGLQMQPRIRSFDLQTNHLCDQLELVVSYKLFDRYELENGYYKTKFREYLYDILQIKQKTPKQITVERRRLLWRGEQAKKMKAKKA